jgi:hypothetical protein
MENGKIIRQLEAEKYEFECKVKELMKFIEDEKLKQKSAIGHNVFTIIEDEVRRIFK